MQPSRGDASSENERHLILSELRDMKQRLEDGFVPRREYEARQSSVDDALDRIESAVASIGKEVAQLRADLTREYVPRGEFAQAQDAAKSERDLFTRQIDSARRDITELRERVGLMRGNTAGLQGMLGRQFDLFQVILGAAAGAFFYWLFMVHH